MEKIPVMDQGPTPTCYAHSASQLIDAFRFSHGDRNYSHLTSPLVTAVYYATARKNKSYNTGFTDVAIAEILRRGSCSEQAIETQFHVEEFRNFFEDIFPKFESRSLLRHSEECYSAQPRVLDSSVELIGFLDKDRRLAYLERVFKEICKNRSLQIPKSNGIPIEVAVVEGKAPNWRTIFKKTFARELKDNRSQPLEISYCSDVLYNPMISIATQTTTFEESKCKAYHSSVVVGRRKTLAGKCQLLVRNSYGKGCTGYAWECEQGQIWVDQDALIENIKSIRYIK